MSSALRSGPLSNALSPFAVADYHGNVGNIEHDEPFIADTLKGVAEKRELAELLSIASSTPRTRAFRRSKDDFSSWAWRGSPPAALDGEWKRLMLPRACPGS